MTIYEIKDDYMAFNNLVFDLQEKLEEEDRDITEEERSLLMSFLEENEKNFTDKIESYAKFIKNLEAEAAGIESEFYRLQRKKRTAEKLASHLKKNLDYVFKKIGIKEKKAGIFNFKIQKNPPSLVIDRPEDVPEFYIKPQPPVYDTAQIKKDLKDGMKLDFCHLEQSESLRIK